MSKMKAVAFFAIAFFPSSFGTACFIILFIIGLWEVSIFAFRTYLPPLRYDLSADNTSVLHGHPLLLFYNVAFKYPLKTGIITAKDGDIVNKFSIESIQSAEYPGQKAFYKELPDGIVFPVVFHIVPTYIGRTSGELDTILDTVSIESPSGKTFLRNLDDYNASWVLLETP